MSQMETIEQAAMVHGIDLNLMLEKLNEKSYIPLTIPKLYGEYSTASFDASDYAGCISLAKVALEG